MQDSVQESLIYVVGLGSNLGDREATLRQAICLIEALPGAQLLKCSQLRETAPVGGPPQDPYLNGAVLLQIPGSPQALMENLLAIEYALGRERRERWGPRTVDLDLLFSPGLIISRSNLTLPHPRLLERRFALEPLVEIAPWACDPRTGKLYQEELEKEEVTSQPAPSSKRDLPLQKPSG